MSPVHIDPDIIGVSADSRMVKPGYLFAALPGSKIDGRDFISQAIKQGAKVILAPIGTPQPEGAVTLITDDNPRHAYAMMCAAFYKNQPRHIVAVTGTNGKTSTVNFVQQIWQTLGVSGASLGTLGLKTPDSYIEGAMTTPDPQILHAMLADIAVQGIDHLAMEASSHGRDQSSLDGVNIAAAAFTNLTQDHLDYHHDMPTYFAAKARLFSDLLPQNGVAVINSDSEWFETLKSLCIARNLRVIGYGKRTGEAITYQQPKVTTQGYEFSCEVEGHVFDVNLPLAGRFQIDNALAALGLVYAEDAYKLTDIMEALSVLKPVRGRLESVTGHPRGAGVFVDYAHTPDALKNALLSLQDHCEGRLICVFGCGGDRDKAKRPLMAAAVAAYADIAILTDDNPRSEDPALIRKDALTGAPEALEIGDRRSAIAEAISMAREGDVVLIAGKGHEQGQIISGKTYPFDDVSEAENVIQGLK